MLTGQLSMSQELRRKVQTGETDLEPSVHDGSLPTRKGELFQGYRRNPSPSAETWRIYTFKGWMGCLNKSIELAKKSTMKTRGEFQEGRWSTVNAGKK